MEHDLNDMMVFLAVVESGSFTLAADRLGIPKANVSRKVARLEKLLNVTLLERSTRSQQLTEAGRRYVQHCKRIHEEIDLANASVCELFHSYIGEIKIGASVTTGQEILRPALGKFMHKYPELTVQLKLGNKRVDFIEEGFDVVVRIGQLNDSMLIAKKLGSISRKLFASPTYIAKQGLPSDVTDLINHQLLINPINNDLTLDLLSIDNEQYTVDCQPRLIIDDFFTLKQTVIDSLGIAILPEYMCVPEVKTGALVNILPDWAMSNVDVYALYPKHRAKIPKVSAFLEFLVELYHEKLK